MGTALQTRPKRPKITLKPQLQVHRKGRWMDINDWKEAGSAETVRVRFSEEWRWTDKKIALNDSIGALLPHEMKEALRNFKKATTIPMAEFVRAHLAKALKRRSKKDKLKEARQLIEQVQGGWVDPRLERVRKLLCGLIDDLVK